MKIDIEKVINSTASLPSLPAVASEIVQLSRDPNMSMSRIANMLAMDPAMASKVLRLVNSAMYVKPRQVENLHQAIVLMGMNQTMTMALSFSLLKSMKQQQGKGLDYEYFWRRALTSAVSGRVIGEFVREEASEELFLAALLQDIGMLVLDRAVPDFYQDLGDAQYEQKKLLAYEKERLGCDHADLGYELLSKWNFSERTCSTVKYSHDPQAVRESHVNSRFIRCVYLSGEVADQFIHEESRRSFESLARRARSCLHFDNQNLQKALEEIAGLLPEIERLFSSDSIGENDKDAILDQAREMLVNKNMESLHEVEKLQKANKQLGTEARILKETGYRDSVTGAYNRNFLESYLQKVFLISKQTAKPVSIAFVEVDGLQSINEECGHVAGDQMLRTAARMIQDSLQAHCMVARYGGGEFVIVMPGVGSRCAAENAEHVRRSFTGTTHSLQGGSTITLDVFLGLATQGEHAEFKSATEFFAAAEAEVNRKRHDNGSGDEAGRVVA